MAKDVIGVRFSWRMLGSLLVLSVIAFGRPTALLAETVLFPGTGVMLTGQLFRPAGVGPFPAVVALHGCAGLAGKQSALSPRHQDWADRLTHLGFVVLFPDSFGSRGVGPQCRTRDRITRPSRERVDDALAARAYLLSRSDVKGAAISLLGWSNGGSTVLYAVEQGNEGSGTDFARAVAFYPGCRIPAENPQWRSRLPLLILIGAADDWTPAPPCEDLAQRAAAAGQPLSIVVYPGAYHDFDHPDLAVHVNTNLAYTDEGEGSAHSGTDPAARADAIKRVPAFLAQ